MSSDRDTPPPAAGATAPEVNDLGNEAPGNVGPGNVGPGNEGLANKGPAGETLTAKAMSRRRVLGGAARTAAGVSIVGMALGLMAERSKATAATAIRPPGAIDEKDFLGACVRCGLCSQACPHGTLRLAGFLDQDAVAPGTPYFIAREVPCYMCIDTPCVNACPTGALDQGLPDIDEAQMGVARITDKVACINFQGLRCEVCYRVCPLVGDAITLEPQKRQRRGKEITIMAPTVHEDACTGCGKCEHACILLEAAIKVLPRPLAVGQASGEY